MKNPWDTVYEENPIQSLGWYEKNSEPSLMLIEKYLTDKNSLILDVGCGETTLIQELIDKDYMNISGIDISSVAINFLKNNIKLKNSFNNVSLDTVEVSLDKLAPNNALLVDKALLEANVSLEVKDLTQDILFNSKGSLWHDRAVFHFLHSDVDRNSYKKNLLNFLEKDGFFIISCFSKDNSAEKCNNLLVKKYNTSQLVSFFGDEFTLVEDLIYEYTMPWGDKRKFLYCVLKKINTTMMVDISTIIVVFFFIS